MDEQLPATAPHTDARCPGEGEEPPPLSWWLRGLLATASALTGALVPFLDEPRDRWHCPFCAWESA